MPSDYARRGRPRGSGLDDRVQLRRIVELLERDPTLKPTTAIKALGVNDPSTIRRLREKLKAEPAGRPAPATGAPSAPATHAQARTAAASAARPASASRPAAVSAGLAEALPSAATEAQLSWFTQWCALGLSAVSSTVEAQAALLDGLLRMPQVESALRQQLLINEVAKAFCPKRPVSRSHLH